MTLGIIIERDYYKEACERMRQVLEAYEAWESDLILSQPTCKALDEMSEANYNRMIELQAMRNEAMKPFRKDSSK